MEGRSRVRDSAGEAPNPGADGVAPTFQRPRSRFKTNALRYALAAATLAIPMVITIALKGHPELKPVVSVSFLLVVSAAAWWAGLWAGILLSLLAVPALNLAASGGKVWIPHHVDPVGVGILCIISFLVARVARGRRRLEEVLRQANAELERKVRQRTLALTDANVATQNRLAELELLYAQLPAGLCLLDRDLRFVRINEKLASIHGAPGLDHIGRPLRDMVPVSTADALEPLCRKALDTGAPVLGFEWTEPQAGEGGRRRTWLIDCCPAKAGDGSLIGLQMIVDDITERKLSEQLLRRAHGEVARREKEFRILANSIPEICWVSNKNGSVAWYNDRWYEYTGMQNGAMERESWQAYIRPDALATVLQAWRNAVASREGFEMEIPIRGANGEFRWFLTRTAAMHDDSGDVSRWFGTSTDIDELKRSREALIASERELRRVNSDLQQFAYSASHDLQEPIRTVAVYTQMIERRYGSMLQGDASTYLRFVSGGAKRMQTLVRDLLNYVETADVQARETQAVESGEALREALANLAATIEETKAEVIADALPAVYMRRTHLQQIFQNLLGNALKYRGAGSPVIHIAAKRNGCEWIFSVQDNGIGIDPAYKERIFGIFKRLHTSDKYSGTGIGLAICQRIVERYGGRIWVESEPERGSTFFFAVPE
jgi:PAS domain S-box-containing protein